MKVKITPSGKNKTVKHIQWVKTNTVFEVYLPFNIQHRIKITKADAMALAEWILESCRRMK